MHHQAGGLVDDQHFVVFIHDGEVYLLGWQLELVGRLGQQHAYDILRLDLVARLSGFVVHLYAAGFGGGLYLGAGDAAEAHLQVYVEAQRFLPAVDGEAVVFVELLLLLFYLKGFLVHGVNV